MKDVNYKNLKINDKFIWPIAIVLASIILGGSYLFIQYSKIDLEQQKMYKEKQLEEDKLNEARRIREEKTFKEEQERMIRSTCVDIAEKSAVELYKQTCTFDCKEGMYRITQYENAYKVCLQGEGLE